MAKLLTFTEDQFAHLSPHAKAEVKRVVYRKDFQEAVLFLRSKYRIKDFPKINIERIRKRESPVPLMVSHRYRGIPISDCEHVHEFFTLRDYKPVIPGLFQDVQSLAERHGKNDPMIWSQLLYVIARFNLIPRIVTDEEALVFPPSRTVLHSLKRRYAKERKLIEEGKMSQEEASRWSFTFYSSDTIVARVYRGTVVIQMSPDAPMKQVRKVLKAVDVFQKFFKRSKLGARDGQQLNMFNDMAEWHRMGWNENKIQQAVEEKYRRYDIASIGKLVSRATKELGF